MSFVERVREERMSAKRELSDYTSQEERRYTRITLGFRSQGVEQFGREGREECSFGVRCFVVNGTESERRHPPFYALPLWQAQSSSPELVFLTVASGRRVCPLWHEMNEVHPVLAICVGISRQWFPLRFQRHHPTTWPVPVMGFTSPPAVARRLLLSSPL